MFLSLGINAHDWTIFTIGINTTNFPTMALVDLEFSRRPSRLSCGLGICSGCQCSVVCILFVFVLSLPFQVFLKDQLVVIWLINTVMPAKETGPVSLNNGKRCILEELATQLVGGQLDLCPHL